MKFFIDTANLSQIKEAAALGILDGVTTNPSPPGGHFGFAQTSARRSGTCQVPRRLQENDNAERGGAGVKQVLHILAS